MCVCVLFFMSYFFKEELLLNSLAGWSTLALPSDVKYTHTTNGKTIITHHYLPSDSLSLFLSPSFCLRLLFPLPPLPISWPSPLSFLPNRFMVSSGAPVHSTLDGSSTCTRTLTFTKEEVTLTYCTCTCAYSLKIL